MFSFCCLSARVTTGANYFLQKPLPKLSSGESVSAHVCTCTYLLLSMTEGDGRSEGVRRRESGGEGESVYLKGQPRLGSKCPHGQLAVLSAWSSSSSGKVSAVDLTSHSVWVIWCPSGHAGNSVEAVLNNNNNPCMGGAGRGCLSLNSLSISCSPLFPGLLEGCFISSYSWFLSHIASVDRANSVQVQCPHSTNLSECPQVQFSVRPPIQPKIHPVAHKSIHKIPTLPHENLLKQPKLYSGRFGVLVSKWQWP